MSMQDSSDRTDAAVISAIQHSSKSSTSQELPKGKKALPRPRGSTTSFPLRRFSLKACRAMFAVMGSSVHEL